MKSRFFITAILLINMWIYAKAQQRTACVGVPRGNFVRNSASCQSYYYCDGQNAWAGECSNNSVFNARGQMCDHPRNVDCTDCSSVGLQHILNPSNCNGYLRCWNGQKTAITCSSGLVFDARTGECSANGYTAPCTSATSSSICTGYFNVVTLGDPNDCTHFFYCLNGKSYKQSCAPSLYYNAWRGKCELPGTWNYCQGPGQLIIPNENFIDPPSSGTAAPVTTIPSVTWTNAQTFPIVTATTRVTTIPTTTKAPTLTYNFDCSGKPDYSVHTHPYACDQFFRCYKEIATVANCYTDLYWDDKKKQCTSTKPAGC